MANLFNNQGGPQISERRLLEHKYNAARGNLLFVVIFTVLNMGFVITRQFTYFMFSAFVPFFMTDLGMIMSGQYPAEFYTGEYKDAAMFGKGFFYIMLAVAIVILMLYVICWLFSKGQNSGWLIFALVLFSVDTAVMFLLNGISSLMLFDILFHIWLLYYLINGVIAAKKLKNLPDETVTEPVVEEDIYMPSEDSVHIRYADMDAKNRVLLETDVYGHKVIFRRVGKVSELVIDGRVYDEFVGVMEPAYSLEAIIDGHRIEAVFDGGIHVCINADGEEILRKTRII